MTETVTETVEGEQVKKAGLLFYLVPNKRFARDLCSGSAILVGKGWAWLTAAGAREFGARIGYTAVGGYAAAYAVGTVPYAMPVAVLGWCGAALMYAQPKDKAKEGPTPPAPAERPAVDLTKTSPADDVLADEDQEDDELPAPDLDTVARAVRRLAGTQHQGAHLDDVARDLDWDKGALRAALDQWGVRANEFKLRLEGRQRVRVGVRVRDLPAGAGEAPAEGGEGAPPAPAQHPRSAPDSGPDRGPAGGLPEPVSGAAAGPSPRSTPAPSQGTG